MDVRQVSVFLENKRGSLARVCGVIGSHGIDVLALSIAETDNFGICRMVLKDTDEGVRVLREAGYTVREGSVLVVSVPDRPCGLADVLRYMEKEDISVEYLYSFVRNAGYDALIIFKVSDSKTAKRILEENKINVLTGEQVDQI